MPTDVLEQETEVNLASWKPARNAAQRNISEKKSPKLLYIPRKTIWQEIFEGHQEFLGLTPD